LYAGRYLGVPLNVTLINNIISGSSAPRLGAAMILSSGDLTMVNNTISGNSGQYGIWVEMLSSRGPATLRMLNNILWNPSTTTELVSGSQAAYTFSRYSDYNLVRGGMSGTGNISSDPQFVVGDTLYHLQDTSPCIGAGAISANLGGVMLYAPTTDFFEMERPRDEGTNPDMGAVENDLPTAVDVSGETETPTTFALEQNFPNPFNPSTTIRFALPRESNVRLTIYNLLGQKIEELVNEHLAPGMKQVTWEAKVPTGVYLYRLDVVGSNGEMYTETRRMTVLR
jgi:hypothetical protein